MNAFHSCDGRDMFSFSERLNVLFNLASPR